MSSKAHSLSLSPRTMGPSTHRAHRRGHGARQRYRSQDHSQQLLYHTEQAPLPSLLHTTGAGAVFTIQPRSTFRDKYLKASSSWRVFLWEKLCPFSVRRGAQLQWDSASMLPPSPHTPSAPQFTGTIECIGGPLNYDACVTAGLVWWLYWYTRTDSHWPSVTSSLRRAAGNNN